MAINSNKFIIFSDESLLIAENFVERAGHGYDMSSNQLMIKSEMVAVYYLDETGPEWTSLSNNQWVARWRMTPLVVPTRPSKPILTTVYTNPTYYVTHSWTESTPDVVLYRLKTIDINGRVDYTIHTDPSRIATQRVPRTCEQFVFSIQAQDSIGGKSDWSNQQTASLELYNQFHSDESYVISSIDTTMPKTGQGLTTAKMTNDGFRIYYIEDNGTISCNLRGFATNSNYDTSSINPTFTAFQSNISIGSNNNIGGFVADNASNAYFLGQNRTIIHSINAYGWAPPSDNNPMNFQFNTSFTINEIVGSIRDVILSDNYKLMLVAEESGLIHGYSCTVAWNNVWTHTGTLDCNSFAIPAGFIADDIRQITFVENGDGVMVHRGVLDTTGDHNVMRSSIMHIGLATPFNMFGLGGITVNTYDPISFGKGGSFGQYYGPYFIYPLKGIFAVPSSVCDKYGEIRRENVTDEPYFLNTNNVDFLI